MDIEIASHGNATVATVQSARVDYSNSNLLKSAFLDMIDDRRTLICLDLSNVEFMDSRGLSLLLTMSRMLRENGRLCVSHVNDSIAKMFSVTKTDKIIKIVDTVDDGIRYLIT